MVGNWCFDFMHGLHSAQVICDDAFISSRKFCILSHWLGVRIDFPITTHTHTHTKTIALHTNSNITCLRCHVTRWWAFPWCAQLPKKENSLHCSCLRSECDADQNEMHAKWFAFVSVTYDANKLSKHTHTKKAEMKLHFEVSLNELEALAKLLKVHAWWDALCKLFAFMGFRWLLSFFFFFHLFFRCSFFSLLRNSQA